MSHDVVIRGGRIIDGTGAEGFTGDVAIDDGVITVVGTVEGMGEREIDATGLVVSPGFIDMHTHLDAQIGWDPQLTPVSWHGVTTVLLGNCGVTFAPCKPNDRELLAGMMETVEDIPKQAIMTGLPWDWDTYGEYLDSIEKLDPAINVAGLVGHCSVRYYVMGERAVEEQATPEEKKEMADIVGKALDDGAFGFSTNRFEPHKLPDGRSIPGTFAEPEELVEISNEVGSRKGLMQAVGADFDILKAVADSSRVLFSYGVVGGRTGKEMAGYLDDLCQGRDITAITQVRGSGWIMGLQAQPPCYSEAWLDLYKKSFEERLDAIKDDSACAELVEQAKVRGATGWLGNMSRISHWEQVLRLTTRCLKART